MKKTEKSVEMMNGSGHHSLTAILPPPSELHVWVYDLIVRELFRALLPNTLTT